MLKVEKVSKRFANGFFALDEIDLTIKQGEIVSIVGTSGCGKSTLLRIIAGLERPSLGQVLIDSERIREPHPKIGVIFQEPRLMPWLNVRENVQFGLENIPALKYNKAEKHNLVDTILERVNLSTFAKTLPRQLSGGMAQRVAIARALVTQPLILLLDEPFSALDAFTRMKLQDHLLKIWQYNRPTLILVTHDLEEAIFLSDRVIVLKDNPGHIYQQFHLDLARPRKRTDPALQYWHEQILSTLNISNDQYLLLQVGS